MAGGGGALLASGGGAGGRRVKTRALCFECLPDIERWWPSSASCAQLGAQLSQPYVHVVVLCCLVAIINSIDRTAMSVAVIPMSKTYGWSSSVKGAIASSFQVGHTITNLVGGCIRLVLLTHHHHYTAGAVVLQPSQKAGGMWAAVYTPKHVLSWGVVVWSAFTVLTPWAAGWLPGLLVVRACMGLGEGVAFPTMQAIIKGYVPASVRSRALGLMYSGHQIGSILSLFCSPFILTHGSVETLFHLYGSLGFLWLAAWHPMVATHVPASALAVQHHHDSGPSLTDHHHLLHHSAVNNSGSGSGSSSSTANGNGIKPMAPVRLRDMPWRQFARSPAVWAIALAHSTFGLTYTISLAWLPTYYAEQFNLDVKQSSHISVLPWAAMALGTNLSGWAADLLVNQKVLGLTQTRKCLQLVGTLGPGLCFAYLALVPQKGFLFEAVALLTLALGLLGVQAGGFASNHSDIASVYAPVLFGLTNACASAFGSLGVLLVGTILDATGQWSLVLLMVACVNGLCAVVYVMFATSEQLFD